MDYQKEGGYSSQGPPGVGKTTVAKAVASERGWAIIELNASEERNAASIRRARDKGVSAYFLRSIRWWLGSRWKNHNPAR